MVKDKEVKGAKSDVEVLEEVKEKVSTLLGYLEVDAQAKIQMEVADDGRKVVRVDVSGDDDLGRLIGRMGSSLRSLQTVLSLLVNKGREEPLYIALDVNGYRAKREEALKQMALRAADIAKKRARVYELPPMNPAERRVVHMALADDEEVTTESAGEGMSRRVMIKPKNAPEGAETVSGGGNAMAGDKEFDENEILDDMEMSEAKAEPEDISA